MTKKERSVLPNTMPLPRKVLSCTTWLTRKVLGMPSRVIDLFACWWKVERPSSAVVWKMVPICIFWCVWKERNLRCFEDMENSLEDIVTLFFRMLYL
jgi:hypothetical protein